MYATKLYLKGVSPDEIKDILGVNERTQDALEVLMGKQGQDGRWVLEKTPGNMHIGFGTRGRPNRGVTLNAMRVLKRVYG